MITVECPFYKYHIMKEMRVRCEEGGMRFKTRRELYDHMLKYCRSVKNYKDCPKAIELTAKWEEIL